MTTKPLRSAEVPIAAGVGAVLGVASVWAWWLPAALVGAIGFAAATLVRPAWVAPAVFIAVLMDSVGLTGITVVGIPLTVSKATVALGLVVWLVHAAWQRLPLARWTSVTAALLLVVASMVFSLAAARSPTSPSALVPLVGMVMLVVLVHLLAVSVQTRDLPALFWAMSVGFLAVLLSQGPSALGYDPSAQERYTGSMGDANEWATVLLMCSPLVLAWLSTRESRLAVPLIVVLTGLVPFYLLQSLSRSALLSGVLLLPVLVYLVWPSRRPVALVLVSLVLAAPLLIDFDFVTERLRALVDPAEQEMDGSLQTRSQLLYVGLRLWRENWLQGIGTGMFPVEAYEVSSLTNRKVAHNTFLNVAVEQGVLGILTHGYLVAVVIGHLRRSWRQASDPILQRLVLGYGAGLAAYALMALTLNLATFAMAFWLLGIGLVLERATLLSPAELRDIGLRGARP